MPSITDTFLFRGPVYLYNVSLGRLLNKQTPEQIAWEASQHDGEQDEAEVSLQAALPPNANGEARKRKVKARS
nr:hypothetical protein CFP56_04469 [Quercus suber]